MPWVRAVATKRAKPALASQAEKASKNIGAEEKVAASSCKVHRARAI